MKSTRTRAKNDVISSRRSEPIILSHFLPQFYQGRVCKYATGRAFGPYVWFNGQQVPYTADLQWNRVSNLEPSGPKAETIPLGHCGST
ncbi:hypothetical protein AVEN_119991-1 [Araneus ventricosus]|uniref:Uncharacterized protein n=1 Tax=Araneus ventricosus TaxID=182803 RepID=A0A4Y1ZJR2_ARAVE|nr:hypothetical protein AVEN_5100-1 [Araneus ventricosus]GBO45926.1 hypothetical protein AVEN_2983-1 [Araneus ventricosus]GBO46622.1 hypothetical protein AVEN_38858-1 [Araneus ventricosus]GBO46788.1 hypothetical protein AVEN_119991-1 [Araneus ventricosus]